LLPSCGTIRWAQHHRGGERNGDAVKKPGHEFNGEKAQMLLLTQLHDGAEGFYGISWGTAHIGTPGLPCNPGEWERARALLGALPGAWPMEGSPGRACQHHGTAGSSWIVHVPPLISGLRCSSRHRGGAGGCFLPCPLQRCWRSFCTGPRASRGWDRDRFGAPKRHGQTCPC